MEPYERFHIYKGKGSKKSCNIVTTYVGRQTGNYTKFIYFFHGPNSSKSAKKTSESYFRVKLEEREF